MDRPTETATARIEENIDTPETTHQQVRPAIPVEVPDSDTAGPHLNAKELVLAGDLNVLPQERRLGPGRSEARCDQCDQKTSAADFLLHGPSLLNSELQDSLRP